MQRIGLSFINPPYLKKFSRAQRSPAVTKSGTIYFPMWLAYAAGYAENCGYDIDLVDAAAEEITKEAVIKRVSEFAPLLAVVDTSTPSIYNDTAFCEELKRQCPELFIVLVGTHVSALPEDSLQLNGAVDAVAIGEYDVTISELADVLAHGKKLKGIAGLCYRSPEGIVTTESRVFLQDLDRLPMVSMIYKRFLKIENYFNPNALFPMVTITTSRGCPHRCIFCVYPQTMVGHRLRVRSVKNVVDEIEYIKNNFSSVKSIFFEDDTFAANKKRCIQICQEMIQRNISLSWTANARADLDLETLSIMKEAGCRSLCVGFESGDQQLLDNIRKGIAVEGSRLFMEAARKAKILVHGCFIVGLPGETRETMQKTLRLAIDLKPDTMQFYPVMVYPGTEAYRWYEERNLIMTTDFSEWLTPAGQHNTVIKGESLSSLELVEFCDKARRAFYLRPAYIWYKVRQMLRSPREIRRTVKSARTFFIHLLKGSDTKSLGS